MSTRVDLMVSLIQRFAAARLNSPEHHALGCALIAVELGDFPRAEQYLTSASATKAEVDESTLLRQLTRGNTQKPTNL